MTTYALTVLCQKESEADAIATALEPVADVVSYFETDAADGWLVSVYFATAPDELAMRDIVATASANRALGEAVEIEPLPDTDWVAESQRLLPPVRAGGFVIHGSHDRDTVPQDANAIQIDAGIAFGTAHHGTTVGCLEAISALCSAETAADTFSNVLDLGTGSAVLAIALARRLPGAAILATDIDAASIDVAMENARDNRVDARVAFCVADGLADEAIRSRAPFNLIVANILAGPLIALSEGVAAALAQSRDARIVLSGLLDDQVDTVMDAYGAHDLILSEHLSRDGWSTLVLGRG